MLEALSRLEDREGLRCIMVGSDQGREAYVKELQADIVRLGLESVVHLPGDCRDMPAAFMLADLVVSASTDAEAFGRVIVEAQAMGRLVIATDHGAARETVTHGENGWLVPPDDASALVKVMREALSIDSEAAGRYCAPGHCQRPRELYQGPDGRTHHDGLSGDIIGPAWSWRMIRSKTYWS